MRFDDETIREVFGADAAEDEDPERLRKFFFKNRSYQRMRADIPIRILVGHKGIGKSALLRMSHLEDLSNQSLSLWVQPNHLIIENMTGVSFVERVERFKDRLLEIVYKKSFEEINIFGEKVSDLERSAKAVLYNINKKISEKFTSGESSEAGRIVSNFKKNGTIRVYIDDIDRGWSASKEDISNISALVNAARDISNEEKNIQLKIGLRTDAYFLFRTSDESTDKIESNVVKLEWSNHDILIVMALRVARYFGKDIDISEFEKLPQIAIAKELHSIIDERFSVGKGHWDNAPIHIVLLSLTRKRPRDLIKLLSEAGRQAYKNDHELISSSDLEAIFESYSNERVNDIILEFRSELPELEKLVLGMAPTSSRRRDRKKNFLYNNAELNIKLRNVIANQSLGFRNGRPVSPKSLAEFLYKIDFIIARNEDGSGKPKWTYFDQNRMLQSQYVDFGYDWEVHPAYRWALAPKDVKKILSELDI